MAASPGMVMDAPAVLVTGSGAAASVRVGNDDLLVTHDTIWSPPSREFGTGNVIQGSVNARRLLGAAGDAPPAALRCDGTWVLRLGPSMEEASARRIATYLNRAGYPAQASDRGASGEQRERWWVRLAAFADPSGALEVGRKLTLAVPGLSQVAVEESASAARCLSMPR